MTKRTKTSGDIRLFAIIGARARLAELESMVRETREMIRLLGASRRTSTARKRRRHSPAFKARIVRQVARHGVAEVARRHDLARSVVDKWVTLTRKE